MALSAQATQNLRTAAAGVVTNAAVTTTPVNFPATQDQKLCAAINFTIGSLTNAAFTPQVSPDGTNWFTHATLGVITLTATGKTAYVIDAPGMKQFRWSVASAGTTTGSSAVLDVYWRKALLGGA